MAEHAFLTNRRREFIKGDYDLSEAKDRQLKRRIEENTETALTELIEVAESPAIDTTEVFDPDDVVRLIQAILAPNQQHLEPGDISDDDWTHFVKPEKWTDEYVAYADSLYVKLNSVTQPYRDGRFPDPAGD